MSRSGGTLVYTGDLKSPGPSLCGFDPRLRQRGIIVKKINLYLSRRIESYNSEGDSLTLEFRCVICDNPEVKNAAKHNFRHFKIEIINGTNVEITPVASSVNKNRRLKVPTILGEEVHILNEFARLYYIAYNRHENIVLTITDGEISVN